MEYIRRNGEQRRCTLNRATDLHPTALNVPNQRSLRLFTPAAENERHYRSN